ncbi:hypothetical protein QYF36_003740 [Acer negundo]|nr:hypothetical protein QYF36_003740 [Acer negundo]
MKNRDDRSLKEVGIKEKVDAMGGTTERVENSIVSELETRMESLILLRDLGTQTEHRTENQGIVRNQSLVAENLSDCFGKEVLILKANLDGNLVGRDNLCEGVVNEIGHMGDNKQKKVGAMKNIVDWDVDNFAMEVDKGEGPNIPNTVLGRKQKEVDTNKGEDKSVAELKTGKWKRWTREISRKNSGMNLGH